MEIRKRELIKSSINRKRNDSFDKGLNFIPTPEKFVRYQIKKDLERLGRDIKLKMYYKTEPTPVFPEN